MTATFTFIPAEDDTVDSEYQFDADPRWTIQDCRSYGAGFVVVEHSAPSEPGFWIKHHGTHWRLASAKAEVIRRASGANGARHA